MRDAHNEELRKLFEPLGLRSKLANCQNCHVLLPYQGWSRLVYWFAAGGPDVRRFGELLEENFGSELRWQAGHENYEHPRELFVQFMLQPCKSCGAKFCSACRVEEDGKTCTCATCGEKET